MDGNWPPTGEQAHLLDTLASLIERGGAGHFLDAPVVRADERDFPERWTATAVALERVLLRLFWMAHVDLDVALDDRRIADTSGAMLRRSEVEWIENVDGVAHFQIDEIGNDNVAGLLSHEVGRAFTAWIAQASPYRDVESAAPSLRDGTIAAIYLGLGVVVTNASLYNRVASKTVGRLAVSETEIVQTGGLAPAASVYLLAVQAVLRTGPIAAHAGLRSDFRDLLQEMIAALEPHRAALAEHLGLDLAAARPALERDPAPPTVREGSRPEPDLRQRAAGMRTYRVRQSRSLGHAATGFGVSMLVMIVGISVLGQGLAQALLVMVGATTIAGGVIGGRRGDDRCARCRAVIADDAATCPGCGATVAGRIRSAIELHERELEHDDDRA